MQFGDIQKNKDERVAIAKGISHALLGFSKVAGVSLTLLSVKEW